MPAPVIPIEFVINPKLIAEGFTQSEMQCWDNCPEKWYLGYNLMLQKKGKHSWALTYGSWMHDALEQYYKTKGRRWTWNPELKDRGFLDAETLAEYEYWAGLGQIQMEIYQSYYKHEFEIFGAEEIESIVEVDFEGVRLKGMIDMLTSVSTKKGHYILDHKTASRFDANTTMGWDFRFQFLFYCWLAWKNPEWQGKYRVRGFIPNGIKKPALRQKQGEGLPQFLERIRQDMLQRPEEYFYRDTLVMTKDSRQRFEDNILRPKIQRIKMLLDPKVSKSIKEMLVRNKNTDYCMQYGKPCEFFNICRNGIEIEGFAYRIRKAKHQELINDES